MILAVVPRILPGESWLTLAQEWNDKNIRTVTGAQWRIATVKRISLLPRVAGLVTYRREILHSKDATPVIGEWQPILSVKVWAAPGDGMASRLEARGRGSRTSHLLSPFARCGKCGAKMTGTREKGQAGYRCPSKGNGGCGGVTKLAAPVEEYVAALVIAKQQKIGFRTLDDLPEWPRAEELAGLRQRINDQQRNYELGRISAERHFPPLARMEAEEARLRRERRQHEGRQQARRQVIANLAEEWNKPDFTLEQKQAAIGQTLSAVILHPAGRAAGSARTRSRRYSGKSEQQQGTAADGDCPGGPSFPVKPLSCACRRRR